MNVYILMTFVALKMMTSRMRPKNVERRPRCISPRHRIDSYYAVGEEVYLRIPPMSRFRDHNDELLYFGPFCRLETTFSAKKLILCNERRDC